MCFLWFYLSLYIYFLYVINFVVCVRCFCFHESLVSLLFQYEFSSFFPYPSLCSLYNFVIITMYMYIYIWCVFVELVCICLFFSLLTFPSPKRSLSFTSSLSVWLQFYRKIYTLISYVVSFAIQLRFCCCC